MAVSLVPQSGLWSRQKRGLPWNNKEKPSTRATLEGVLDCQLGIDEVDERPHGGENRTIDLIVFDNKSEMFFK